MRRGALLFALLFAPACSTGVPAGNPYDPEAPIEQQIKGVIMGTVIAEAAFDPDDLSVVVEGVTLQGAPIDEIEASLDPGELTTEFQVEAPAGTYHIRASIPEFDSANSHGVTLMPAETVDVGVLQLRVGRGAMVGQVIARSPTAGDSSPPGDTRLTLVRLVAPLPQPGVTAECEEPGLEEVVTAPLKADGSFTALDLAAGPYLVTAERDGYVPAFSSGSVQVAVGEVADAGQLVLLLSESLLRITPAKDADAAANAGVTRHYDVTLEIAAPPLYNGMLISEDATFSDLLLGDVEYGPVQSSLTWTVTDGEGSHELFLLFRSPTCRASPLFMAGVVLDTTAPIAAPPALAAGGTCTRGALAALSLAGSDPCAAEDCAGLYQMRLADDGVLDSEPWVEFDPEKTLDLGGDGDVEVAFQVKDRAGNTSVETSTTILVNSTGPVVGSPAFLVDGGANIVYALNCQLSLNASAATRVEVGNGTGLDGSAWVDMPVTGQLSWRLDEKLGDGPRQVVVRYGDDCDNVTEEYSVSLDLDRTGRIRGSVRLFGELDHGLTGVSLWVLDPGSGTYSDTGTSPTSGTDGAFFIPGLDAGTYRLDFTHTGFVSRTITGIVLAESAEVVLPEYTLEIARGDLDGKVTLLGEDSHEGILVRAAPGVVTFTDVLGNFLFTDLPVDAYLLSAEKGAAYVPKTAAGLVQVVQGDTETAPAMVLDPVPGTVAGNAKLEGQATHANINVVLRGVTVAGTETSVSTTSGDSGDFGPIDLTAGTYSATLSAAGFETWKSGPLVLSPTEDLVLDSVTLQVATGAVTGNATYSDKSSHGGIKVSLRQANQDRAFTYTNDAGDFALVDVPAGTYTVRYEAAGYGRQDVTPVIVEPNLTENIDPAVVLTPQVGDVTFVGLSGATNLTSIQIEGNFPDVQQARFCEDPAILDPADFPAGDCDYQAVTNNGPGFDPVTKSFKATECPLPGGNVEVCDGAKIFWVRLKDGSGLESVWFELPVILDQQAPSGNVVISPNDGTRSGQAVIADGDAYTQSLTVPLLITAQEDTSAVAPGDAVSGVVSASLYLAIDDVTPTVTAIGEGTKTLASFDLAGGNDSEARSVYLVLADAAGNESVTALGSVTCPEPRSGTIPTNCDTIFFDQTATPTLAFSIDPPGADYAVSAPYAASPVVELGIDSTIAPNADEDLAVTVTISNDMNFLGAVTQPLAGPKEIVSWVLSAGDEQKTVYIKVRDKAGNLSGSFEATITLDTQPPSPPLLVEQPAYVATNAPLLDFAAVPDAVSYVLQLADVSTFDGSGSLHIETSPAGTDYASASLADVTHYWRVKAIDAAGLESAYSAIDAFTVDTADPVAPALNALAAEINDLTPDLAWNSIGDAVSYEVHIDVADTYDVSLIARSTAATTLTSPTLGELPYFARVRSVDAAGNPSAWSADMTFTVDVTAPGYPNVTAPGDSVTVTSANVDFAWAAVSDAVLYVFEIGQGATPSVYSEYVRSDRQQTLGLADGLWTFRVGTEDAAGNRSNMSAATNTRSFTVDTAAPNTPTLTSLASLITTAEPTFGWSDESGSGADTYILKVDGTTVDPAVRPTAWTEPPYTALSDGAHSWTVAAVDPAGNQSVFAALESFTVDTTAPDAPVLTPVSPDPGTITQPTFAFAPVADAVRYQVQWDTATTFNSGNLGEDTITSTSTQPPAGLAKGTWYFRVIPYDAAGNFPIPATLSYDTFVIDLDAPIDAVISSPAGAAKLASAAVSVVWGAVADADTYRLEIDTDTSFDNPLVDSGLTTTSKNVALGDGTFYARVLAVDLAGNTSPGTAYISFVVDTTAPDTPTLAAVTTPTSDTQPIFDWNSTAGSGATGYSLLLDGAEISVDEPVSAYQPPVPLGDGSHSVSVAAEDDAGNRSPYSSVQIFDLDDTDPDVPTLTPVSPDPTNQTSATLSFTAVSDAISYTVEWGTDSGFVGATTESVATTQKTLTGLTGATWYWRVEAVDDAGNHSGFASSSFVVDLTEPADVSLTTPANNSFSTSSTVTFDWANIADADVYLLDVSSSVGLASYDRYEVTTSSKSLALPDSDWYWRVLARDEAGNVSPTASATERKVTVDTVDPAVPTLTAEDSPTNDKRPTLQWSGPADAVLYVVTIDATTDTTASTDYTPSVDISDGSHTWTVASRDQAGNESSAAPSQSFVIDSTRPATPTLTAYTPDPTTDNTPTVTWSTVSDAVSYTVHWDVDSGFTSGSHGWAATSSTSHVIGPLTGDPATQWYWMVVATDQVGNDSLEPTPDDFIVDTNTPAAPSRLTPANPSTVTTSSVDFTWTASAGAVSYRLQIGSDVNLTTILFDVSDISATSTSQTLSDNTYYWRVLATDAAGNQTDPTGITGWEVVVDANSPAKPTLSTVASPTGNATPTFSWTDESSSGAVEYLLVIDSQAPIVEPDTSYTPVSALSDGVHTVEVASRDAANNDSVYTAQQSFTVDTGAPTDPSNLVPLDSTVELDSDVGFTWDASTDTYSTVSYQLQVARATDFATLVVDQALAATTTDVTLADDAYWWRVRAVDSAGNSGSWSPSSSGRQLTVDTTPPDVPRLNAVGTLVSGIPELTWSDESNSGAVSYRVTVYRTGPVQEETTTTAATSYTPTLATGDEEYSWAVTSIDANTLESSASSQDSFTLDTDPPAAPGSPSPAAAYSTNNPSVSFSWSVPAGSPTSYRVEIAYDAGFLTLAQEATTALTSAVITFPDGDYFWRVIAIDAAGNDSSPAGGTDFAIDTVGPRRPLPTITPAWVNEDDANVIIGWSDESDSGAVSYSWQVDDSSAFDSLYDSGTTGSLSVGVPAPAAETKFYWRVWAVDGLGNTSSLPPTPESFTVDTTDPTQPNNVAPADANQRQDAPTVVWSASVDTYLSHYQVQIGQEPTFTNQIVVDTTTTGTTSAQALSEGTYYWRVWGVDDAGNESVISAVWSFTIDWTPPSGTAFLPMPSLINSRTPTLKWAPVSGAATYTVWVDDDPEFPAARIEEVSKNAPTVKIEAGDYSGPLADGTYYAIVWSEDAAGNASPWSPILEFEVDGTRPFEPTMCALTPPATYVNAVGEASPTFTWDAVTGVTSYEFLTYQWDAGLPGWLPPTTFAGIPPNGESNVVYTVGAALADGELYRFEVWSWDSAGNKSLAGRDCGIAAGQTTLRSDQSPPGGITGLSVTTSNPTNGSVVAFEWDKMQDTTSGGEMGYTVELLAEDRVTVLQSTAIAWSPAWNPVPPQRSASFSALVDGRYFVRVTPWDAALNQGGKAESNPVFEVDSSAPQMPIAYSPLQSGPGGGPERTTSVRPDFSWSDESGSGATQYTLDIWSATSGGVAIASVRTVTGLATTTHTLSADLPGDGHYRWYVIAYDAAGNPSQAGGTGQSGEATWFQVDTTAPNPLLPASLSPDGVTFRREDLALTVTATTPNPVAYTIEIYDSTNGLVYTSSCELVPGTNCYLDAAAATFLPAEAFLPDGTYYWRVQAADDLGNTTLWAPVDTGAPLNTYLPSFSIDDDAPNAPMLIGPADDSYTNDTTPLVDWTDEAGSGATSYLLFIQYDNVGTWTDVSGYMPKITGADLATPNLSAYGDTRFRYYVRSRDAALNESGVAMAWEFEIDTQAPGAPATLSLTPGSRQLLASWGAVTDVGSSGVAYYEVQFDSDSGFGSPGTETTTSTTITIDGLDNRRQYYVRVQAYDNAGTAGSFSPTASTIVGLKRAVLTDALADRELSSPNMYYSDGHLFVSGTVSDAAGGDNVAIYRCQVERDNCREAGSWTAILLDPNVEIANSKVSMAATSDWLLAATIEDSGASTYAPVIWTCNRSSDDCDDSASWTRTMLEAYTVDVSTSALDVAVSSTHVFVSYLVDLSVTVTDWFPRLASCPFASNCSLGGSWNYATSEAAKESLNGSIALAATDRYVWGMTHEYNNGDEIDVRRCDIVSDCDVDADWAEMEYVNGTWDGAIPYTLDAVVTGSRLYVTFYEGGSPQRRFARCDLASGCALTADWAYGTVFSGSINSGEEIRLAYGAGALHATWWRESAEWLTYAYCTNPDVTDCTAAANWQRMDIDSAVAFSTIPGVAVFEENVGLVWLDDTNRLRSALPTVVSPLKVFTLPGVAELRGSWSYLTYLAGYEQLYDNNGVPGWDGVIVLGDPLYDRNTITVAAGVDHEGSLRAVDSDGQVSDDAPLDEVRPWTMMTGYVSSTPDLVTCNGVSFGCAQTASAAAGTRRVAALVRGRDGWVSWCDRTGPTTCEQSVDWTQLEIYDVTPWVNVYGVEATAEAAYVVWTNNNGEVTFSVCDWALGSGCTVVGDWKNVVLVTQGQPNAPQYEPSLSVGAGRVWVATRDSANGVRVHHCSPAVAPLDCSNLVNWTQDIIVTADASTLGHSIAAGDNMIAIARPTDTAIKYYWCDGTGGGGCAGFSAGSTLVSRVGPNLAPLDDSVRLAMDGDSPSFIANWDDELHYAFCPFGAGDCESGSTRWASVTLHDVFADNSVFGSYVITGGQRYVLFSSLDRVYLGACGTRCGERDSWSIGTFYKNTGLNEPGFNNQVLWVDPATLELGFSFTYDPAGAPAPRHQGFLDGRYVPQ